MKYIMAFDQGTTSSRCILFDRKGKIASTAQKEFAQFFPKPGYVEHDPMEIWALQIGVAKEAMLLIGAEASDIAAIGITNQRETTIVWDRQTGKPIYNAIVWQCRRTAELCDEMKRNGLTEMIQQKTGLLIDAYFSATKLKWILDNVKGAREKANNGDLLFGTVETWLIWNLTGGKVHATDYSNASRTMLFNINTLQWDKELLELFDIPETMLPQVKMSGGLYGMCDSSFFGKEIAISGAAGDQQAALFGQCCFNSGDVKNTYGTGGFMLMNTGESLIKSSNGLLSTIAWGMDGKITYALEGSVFVAGALIQWLRDELELIRTAAETEEIAEKTEDTNGVYIVPAFVGLGAPYWNQHARGTIIGLTRGTGKKHIVRSALEAIAYQTADVLTVMKSDAKTDFTSIRVDGGASANNFLLQFQSDILGSEIVRPSCIEVSALGVAFLAGIAVGFWKNTDEVSSLDCGMREFKPQMTVNRRNKLLLGWEKAVKATLSAI